MLNETLPRQDTALALSIGNNVTIFLVPADHNDWRLGPVDDREAHRAESVVTGKNPTLHMALSLSMRAATSSSTTVSINCKWEEKQHVLA